RRHTSFSRDWSSDVCSSDLVYHYAADTHRFGRVRSGDYRGAVVEASGGEPSVAEAPALLVATSTFWRNAWRYKERAYRHTWWDRSEERRVGRERGCGWWRGR